MSTSKPVTETLIVQVKGGVDLSNVSSNGTDSNRSTEEQTFARLADTVKVQAGFVRQYWGHQVENPHLFVWSIDWKSYNDREAAVRSKSYEATTEAFNQLFDTQAQAPFTIFTPWDSDPTPCYDAPITEVAFFTLNPGQLTHDEAKKAVGDALAPIGDAVIKVGKATGDATGWSFQTQPQEGGEWLAGVFGYASLEVHMKWRQAPEHAQAEEIFAELEKNGLQLRPAPVPGIGADTGYFHVHFQKGC